jgi:hypothetical protein
MTTDRCRLFSGSRTCDLLLRCVLLLALVSVGGLGGCAASQPTPLAPAPAMVAAAAGVAPAPDVARSRELLAVALEREALYTIAGGLKPMSTGFWQARLNTAEPDTAELDAVRAALSLWHTPEIFADVQSFQAVHEGKRTVEAYVVHVPAMAAMLHRHRRFWAGYGITPASHPAEVLAVTERMAQEDRWRGYGYLFGYPDYAVDFFVDAGRRARETSADVGPGKDRSFVAVPVASAETGRFTWAAPLGHVPGPEDERIRSTAMTILERYRSLRPALDGLHPQAAIGRVAGLAPHSVTGSPQQTPR